MSFACVAFLKFGSAKGLNIPATIRTATTIVYEEILSSVFVINRTTLV